MKNLLLAAVISTALSVSAGAAETRTVMWFVGHPAEMKAMLVSCRNDPGDARNVPECENVTQAELVLAAAEASAMTDMTSPRDPRYWQRHPAELPRTLFNCEHVDRKYWHILYCDSAHASLSMPVTVNR